MQRRWRLCCSQQISQWVGPEPSDGIGRYPAETGKLGDEPARPKRRRVSPLVKIVAGVVTFAATIAGTYLAFQSRPKSFTTADWARQANAACERDTGDLALSLSDGLISVTHLLTGQASSTDRQTTVHSLIADAGALDKMLGDLRGLQTPVNNPAVVAAVLKTGNAVVSNLGTISVDMQTALMGVPDSQGRALRTVIAELGDTLNTEWRTAIPAWQKAIKAAGLTQCPLWVPHPNPTPTLGPVALPTTPAGQISSPPTPTPLSYSEQQLVSQLNPSDLASCTRRPDEEVGGVVAAVNCSPVWPGPTKRPLVVRFSDAASAQAWFAQRTQGIFDENDCAGGHKLGTWTYHNLNAGMLGCTATNGGFRMVWVIDSALIGVIADGSDGTTMVNWFRNWAYVISSGT